jgi:hypothetical protein
MFPTRTKAFRIEFPRADAFLPDRMKESRVILRSGVKVIFWRRKGLGDLFRDQKAWSARKYFEIAM